MRGLFMKKTDLFLRIPENAVFWLLLLFLTAGSAVSLYGKAADRTGTVSSGRILSPVSVVSSQAAASALSPIASVPDAGPYAALTFDLLSAGKTSVPVLQALEKSGTKATFFVSSDWVASHPEETAAIAGQGHELGITVSPSFSGRDISRSQIRAGLEELEQELIRITGRSPSCFRPQSGENDDPAADEASAMGYTIIGSSCDSQDWKDYGSDAIVRRILKDCAPDNGCILRFRGDARYTADALPEIIQGLTALGLSPVTVSSLFPVS